MAGSGVLETAITESRVNVVRYLLSNSDAYAAHRTDALPNPISPSADVEPISKSKS